jgi:hypothetical protein
MTLLLRVDRAVIGEIVVQAQYFGVLSRSGRNTPLEHVLVHLSAKGILDLAHPELKKVQAFQWIPPEESISE